MSKVKQGFVVFKGLNEVIVTVPAEEKRVVKEYFTDGGRGLEEYDREEWDGEVAIEYVPRVDGNRLISR
jgi:hypothetical protein